VAEFTTDATNFWYFFKPPHSRTDNTITNHQSPAKDHPRLNTAPAQPLLPSFTPAVPVQVPDNIIERRLIPEAKALDLWVWEL
jgi:hypothetical protein